MNFHNYLFLYQYKLSNYIYGTKKPTLDELFWIVIPDLLTKLMFCHEFPG